MGEPRQEDGEQAEFSRRVEPHRRELLAYCYRMAGSLQEAEDLLQEALLRAWRAYATFEERSSMRTWLYRIATNVCLDALEKRAPRVLPAELGPAADPATPMVPRLEPIWIEPYPDHLLPAEGGSPETRYSARESVALAFLTLLQVLPPRQRAVLLLHEVLGCSIAECAEALATTGPAVNSALQRARESLSRRTGISPATPDDEPTRQLLERYLRAWEAADVPALVALLAEDATFSMPPFPMWLRGTEAIARSLAEMVLPPGSGGQFRLLPTRANGVPAFATYRIDPESGTFHPLSLQLLSIRGGRIEAVHAFLDASLFPRFSLPPELPRG